MPAWLRELVIAYVRSAECSPRASLRSERISRNLLGPTGERLAELVDDTVEAHEDVQDCSASTRTWWARQRRRVAWHWPAHRVAVTTPALD